MQTLLSIDCGTQSLRVLLFDIKGNLLAKEKVEYEPYFSTKPNYAEQHAEIFWSALCTASLKLKEKNSELFAAVAGLSVSTQRDTFVNLAADGNPVRPAITWLDRRKAKIHYRPNFFMKLAFGLVGMNEAVMKTQVEGKCNWLMQNEPENWAKTHKYLIVSGYLNYKLTGTFNDSIASQIGHFPFDYKRMRWAKTSERNYKLFPVEHSKLPNMVQPGDLIGHITAEASALTGIAQGTPVIAAGSDKGCETIGMGVTDTSMVSLSFGTTATIQTTTKKYMEPLAFMPAYPAPIKGHYNPEVEIFRGYWMITWFKNEFGQKEIQRAEQAGVPPEEILNELLREVPAGSMGLMVQPYWSPGLKFPNAKGAMIGFGDVHKRAHVYKAVIEGLGYGLYDGLLKIEKVSGKKVLKAAVSGGAAQSDEICKITADIFNIPMVRGKTFETTGLGAAIITAAGLGIYPNLDQAVKNMVSYEQTFMPDPENHLLYSKLYNSVYRKIFPSLTKLYSEIRDITGYPEKPE